VAEHVNDGVGGVRGDAGQGEPTVRGQLDHDEVGDDRGAP
jgi:hypothetical protein